VRLQKYRQGPNKYLQCYSLFVENIFKHAMKNLFQPSFTIDFTITDLISYFKFEQRRKAIKKYKYAHFKGITLPKAPSKYCNQQCKSYQITFSTTGTVIIRLII
jgi:hypothetical protein